MAAVWKGSQHSGSALLMMLAIADFSDDKGVAFPSVATLAEKTRMKPRNANYLLTELQASGELVVKVGAGRNGTNLYRIVLSRLDGRVTGALPLQPVAPLQSSAALQPGAPLHPSAAPPAPQCLNPLHCSADKPSLNHQEPSGSEAEASDAAASMGMSAKERAWAIGPAVLGQKARPLLGRLAKQYGDEVLADALEAAYAQLPLQDPKAWVVSACARAKATKGTTVDKLADPKPSWAVKAGFATRFEAENDGCYEHNAAEFSNGKRRASK